MSSDSDLCVAEGEANDDDPDLVVAAAHPLAAVGSSDASRQRGRRWRYSADGTFLCWLLVDGAKPSPVRLCSSGVAQGLELLGNTDNCLAAVGVAQCKWMLRPSSPEASECHSVLMPPGRVPVSKELGYLQYQVDNVFRFDDVLLIPPSQRPYYTTTLQELHGTFLLNDVLGTVSNAVCGSKLCASLELPLAVVSSMLRGELGIVHSVRLTKQLRYQGVVGAHPPRYNIRHYWHKWERDATMADLAPTEPAEDRPAQSSDAFLRHPRKRGIYSDAELKRPCKQSKWDPLKLIYSVQFGHELKDERQFPQAFDHSSKYARDPSDEEAQPPSTTAHPSRSTRQRARHKTDVVGMLLERREFDEWYQRDLVRSIHVYSDASPVVGVELQGQLIDVILVDGSIRRRVFPGAELPYGFTGVVSKCVALVWGFFLTVGPEKGKVQYALAKTRSVTTDNGTEIGLNTVKHCLNAFYVWMGGTPVAELGPLIENERVLLENSIRVIGIGHTMGSIMKEVCESYSGWQPVFDQIRALVSFFRNRTYRQHMSRLLKHRVNVQPLKHFFASFIKWRYETLAQAISELNHLRQIAEGFLREELFNNVQDKESFKTVCRAAVDKKLWRWMAVAGKKTVIRAEKVRRWSMVCNCPAHVLKRRATKKRVVCNRNSRRLGEILDFTRREVLKAREDATKIAPSDCEDDQELCNEVRDMLNKYASLLELRTKYFAVIPWRFATATEPEGAAACLQQLLVTPEARLDPVSKKFALTLKHDLEVVAAGGPASPALLAEVKTLLDTPLDESAGEGYHRLTNLTYQRAPVSTTETIVQDVRLTSCLSRVDDVVARYGAKGRAVIRYEWRNWKRVLQSNPKRSYRNVRLSATRAFRRIYREDSRAKDNWDALLYPAKADPPRYLWTMASMPCKGSTYRIFGNGTMSIS